MATEPNRTVLVIGYGSLLSGYGMLARRRGGKSRLVAREAFAVSIQNARRGLAKPSSHGHYLAMDIERIERPQPITARVGIASGDGIGGVGLVFEREWLETIARREEYDPAHLLTLLNMADRAGARLGEFLYAIAERVHHDPLAYRRALRELIAYTSPGYVFHPLALDDGRVAIVAISSGYDGSGDPAVISRRREFGMERLLTIGEALALKRFEVDRDGQLGYFVECLLGGLHGVDVSDLAAGVDSTSQWAGELWRRLGAAAADEPALFLAASGLSAERYRERFRAVPFAALTHRRDAGDDGGAGRGG